MWILIQCLDSVTCLLSISVLCILIGVSPSDPLWKPLEIYGHMYRPINDMSILDFIPSHHILRSSCKIRTYLIISGFYIQFFILGWFKKMMSNSKTGKRSLPTNLAVKSEKSSITREINISLSRKMGAEKQTVST